MNTGRVASSDSDWYAICLVKMAVKISAGQRITVWVSTKLCPPTVVIADVAVQDYQISVDAMQARYDGGLASLLDLETSRRLLISALTARVQLQQERSDAWVALYRAMGGGWVRPDGATAISQQETTSSKSQ